MGMDMRQRVWEGDGALWVLFGVKFIGVSYLWKEVMVWNRVLPNLGFDTRSSALNKKDENVKKTAVSTLLNSSIKKIQKNVGC